MQAPYSQVTITKISPSAEEPQVDPIKFVKGDQKTMKYLFKNIVYTETRPVDDSDLPMYSADEITAGTHTAELDAAGGTGPYVEGTDYSATRLIADWEQHYWHAEIRNGYLSTYRMYNGWVPWYGRRPQWSWWNGASLRGYFVVTAEYNDVVDSEGTVVTCILPSKTSRRITPSTSYRWDLESSIPVWDEGLDPEVDDPSGYTALRTWIGGKAQVLQDWTQNTVIV